MRDVLVTFLVFASLPFILKRPYIGILVWSWLSYMNPHRLGWGFAYSMPFAQIVAAVLFVAIIFSSEKKRIPMDGVVVVWIMFILWMLITTAFAFYPDSAQVMLSKVLKIQLVTFLTLMLMTDKERVDQLIWVIAMSIGFFSVKGGVFTILTGGGFRVWGPPGSYIEENNGLAVATLMIIPLIVYLYRITKPKWQRYGLAFAGLMSLVSVVGSQSRGALLAMAAVGGFFWLKTKTKFVSGISIVVLASIGLVLMPASWQERMGTIQNYEQDASAMSRINSWQYSINVASDRLTGGGFNSWTRQTFAIYAPNPESVFVAHSIYFSVLGEHGWPGLVLFLLILFLTWRSLSKTIKLTNNIEGSPENILARMLQVSLIAYMAGGAFLSLSYFDLSWHLIAISVLISHQLGKTASLHNGPDRKTNLRVKPPLEVRLQ